MSAQRKWGRCMLCRIRLHKDNLSLKTGLCAACYAEAMFPRKERDKAEENAVTPICVYHKEKDRYFPKTDGGGFDWKSAIYCPLG